MPFTYFPPPEFKDIPEQDAQLIRVIQTHMRKAEAAMNQISNETRDKMLAYHNEDASIPHCLRWGEQAADELVKQLDLDRPGEPPCGACGTPSTTLHHLDGDPDTLGHLDVCDSCLDSKWWPMFSPDADGDPTRDSWFVVRGMDDHDVYYETQAEAQATADRLNAAGGGA